LPRQPVSPPRSSNRTCGFPASGFPTGFVAGIRQVVDTSVIHISAPPWHHDTARSESSWSHAVLHRLAPIHRPSPPSTSTPEVRVLPSAGVTRFQRYHDPVRRPPGPMPLRTVEAATLITGTGLPRLRNPCLDVLFPLPRWTGPGAFAGCFPSPCCLPRSPGGSASTTSLSGPAQALLTLRPVESLDRQKRPLSQGFDTASYPTASPVSYRANRPLPGWDLHPQGVAPFGAHQMNTNEHR